MRLIDADAFKNYIVSAVEDTRHLYKDNGEWAEEVTEEFCKAIDEQPTIVEFEGDINKVIVKGEEYHRIVRCKDCIYFDKYTDCIEKYQWDGFCADWGRNTYENWYCNRAERRGESE